MWQFAQFIALSVLPNTQIRYKIPDYLRFP